MKRRGTSKARHRGVRRVVGGARGKSGMGSGKKIILCSAGRVFFFLGAEKLIARPVDDESFVAVSGAKVTASFPSVPSIKAGLS